MVEGAIDFASMDDVAFESAWFSASDEERNTYRPGFDRYSRLRGPINGRRDHSGQEQSGPSKAEIMRRIETGGWDLFRWASLADLDTNPPPDRQFVVQDWIPAGTVALLSGAGGVGKSLLAQQIATCVANGLPIFGKDVQKGPVVGIFAEDDEDELRRRQRWILRAYGRSAAFSTKSLFLEGRAGKDSTLMTFGPDRIPARSTLLEALKDTCRAILPALVIVDNVSQVYGGPENSRHEVTVFCNELASIASRRNCAVLLLGHVAKAEGSEYSGSTAWEAAVRTRLWLERREDGLLELHRRKANYAGLDSVTLEFQGGALAEVRADGMADESAAIKLAEAVVLSALATFTARQVAASHSPNAITNLVRIAAREGMLAGTPPPLATRALNALIDRGDLLVNVELGWRGKDRHVARGLAVKP